MKVETDPALAAERRAESMVRAEIHAHRGFRNAAGFPVATKRSVPFPSTMRAETVTRDGKEFFKVSGYASIYDRQYEMWDMFGPYMESVDAGAGDVTLATKPDVVFLVNHTGLAMARTKAGTLDLSNDDTGLADVAFLNPERNDVKDLVHGIEDKVITEQSFAFYIEEGWWNDDFTAFRIVEYNIDRGDVSAVNYGANPYTSIAARQRDLVSELRHMPETVAHAVLRSLASNEDFATALRTTQAGMRMTRSEAIERAESGSPVTEQRGGRSIAHVMALLEEGQ
jgi:HK97 family phage prohead protease